MDQWISEQLNLWFNEWMNKWMNEWMNKWMTYLVWIVQEVSLPLPRISSILVLYPGKKNIKYELNEIWSI